MTLLALFIGVPHAFAADPCDYIGGCSANSGQAIIQTIAATLGQFFLGTVGGAAVLFIMIGGFLMIMNWGDEGMVTKGRNAVLYSMGGLALALAANSIVQFFVVGTRNNLQNSPNPVVSIIAAVANTIFAALNAILVLAIVIAGYRMVIAHGKQEDFNKARTGLIWALAGTLIVNVAASLARMVVNLGF